MPTSSTRATPSAMHQQSWSGFALVPTASRHHRLALPGRSPCGVASAFRGLFGGRCDIGTAGTQGGRGDAGLGSTAEDLAAAAFTLARRCAAGATVWCCAPAWPSHAHHVAVEFVHPVVVGKRALPAAVAGGPDLLAALRLSCRAGDVVVAIARSDDDAVAGAMRRAPAWGVTTIWIGVGQRPPPGAADHVVWVDGGEAAAAYGGGFVLVYHLLWELSQVCLEHPGLMAEPAECEGPVCVTCSDEGRLGEVVAQAGDGLARVRTADGLEAVDTTLVGAIRPGDLLLVHAGTALSLLDGGVR